jgi:hypothetical protein
MEMLHRKANRPDADGLLATWRQQLQTALRQPWLAAGWLAQNRALLQRFTRTYEHLRQQPRPVRRRLQRQWGASLAGAALAIALLNAPAHAVPSGITVDGTTCTLVDAITAANSDTATGGCAAGNGADTITLQTDVTLTASNNYAVNSDNGLPVISSEITIEGAGHMISRDAGAPAFRLLLVNLNGNLTLHQTTLSGGNSQQSGGAIHNLGTVTVNNSTFSGNSASHGGAIFNSYATVTVSNSTLSDNTASFAGGSIYSTSDSTLTISDSTLSGNSAEGGGAIYNYGTVTISDSTLSGNSADQGGAIYNKIGGTVSISISTLSDNTANDNGGAINNESTVTVSNSTLSGNTASTNGGGINNNGTATVSNSSLSGNSAGGYGGGIYNSDTVTVSNSTLSGNTGGSGGGIYNDNGTVTVSNSTLSGNSAGGGRGGGISNSSTVSISNSTLSGNTASFGGGIYNSDTLNLARSLISGNSAGDGAEIYNAATINAANFNLIGYGGDARSTNFTPSDSDIVPSQALAAILNTTLADNGGPSTGSGPATLTHALVPGSPAIDAAGDSGLATDQRGITRPQGAADDIGAFELEVVPATITIVLDTQPNLPTNLGFSGSLGAFLLDDPAVDDSDAYTNTKSFSVAPGAYTVRRNNATGWFLTNITCTPTGKTAINLFQRTAILTVASGDSVTCTYTVQRGARILARAFDDRVRNSSNLGRRNAADPWLDGWAMNVFRAPNAPVANGWTGATSTAGLYQASFATLKPGDYTVCTVLPAGSWTPTTPNATNPDYANQPCKAVTLAPGQLATVLFGAYQSTVVASTAFTPADELVTDEDTIVNLPYDPAEDETATQDDGLPRLFLPLVAR